jgi:ABC-type hemin transport system substrate-binding protein
VIGHREQKHGMLSACAAMIVHLTGHRFFVITSRSLHGSDMMESGYDYTDNSIVAMAAAASGTSEADAMSRMIAARPDVVAMDERPAVRHLTHGPGKRKKKRK